MPIRDTRLENSGNDRSSRFMGHQFRITFPLVMIDCNRSKVFRCMHSCTKA